MIDVAEDTHHRWSRFEVTFFFFGSLFLGTSVILFRRLGLSLLRVATMFYIEDDVMLLRDLDGDGLLDRLIHRGENPHLHEFGDELERL